VLRYVADRIVQMVPVLFGITLFSFLLIHLVPGDPARLQLGPHATPAQVAALQHQLGLDKPLIQQYLSFLGGVFKLSFGQSLSAHQSVGSLIGARVGVTALTVLYSLVISLIVTIPLGVWAAVRRDQPIDHAIRIVGMIFFGMPTFWLGLLLILLFGLDLGLFPTSGYEGGLGGALKSLTLPAVTMGLGMAPPFLRSLRGSVIQTLDTGFVEAARARGFSERRVLYRHVLRNSSISTVTLVGVTIGGLISFTVVIENVFAIPGLGALLVSSVSARDYPTIQGLVVVLAVAVVVINLLTDLTYAAIDPRVRYDRGAGAS
jgi:peptide/nickel transport system permease protein